MNNVSYSKLAYQELVRDGSIEYGRIDLLIERCRGADEIMRAGSIEKKKVSFKYIAGEPLSDEEANIVYETGLRMFRERVARNFRRSHCGIINDKSKSCFIRSTLGSKKPSV